MEDKRIEVYDIETLAGCFTYTGLNIYTNKIVQFVLYKDRWELDDLITHLNSLKGQIGFNNLNFDYPIIHYILLNWRLWKQKLKEEEIITLIYQKAQWIIEQQNNKGDNKVFVSIKDKEVLILQLDLYRIWHFNNKARIQSLKGLEIAMNMNNVMDMPIHHSESNISLKQIDEILAYNLHDVEATYEFYLRSKDKIELRKKLSELYNINLINSDDVKIGETIFLELLSKEMDINKWDLRKLRTNRKSINLSDIILPYIEFNTKPFKELLTAFKGTVVSNTKDSFKFNIIDSGMKYLYGQGGLHSCIDSGVYEVDDKYGILDIDVKSFYPNIAVNNKLKPEHLGEAFTNIYSNIYKERSKIDKKDPRNGAYKLMLNGCFGKAGDKYSFLFDIKFLLSITINGQLLLTMLLEKLLEVNDITILQCNTDGITVKYNRNKIDLINTICKDWEDKTKLELEYQEYSKMVLRDVNNYCAITDKGKVKYKGAYEIEKDYHKDNSFKIIPYALSEYFIKETPIKDTIINHKNIYDFCGRQKFTSDSYGETHILDYNYCGQPYNKIERQQKNVRYFISNNGSTFIKQYTKGSSEVINKGYQVIVFNKYYKSDNYDINYDYYIKEAQKEIDNIVSPQLTLF